MLVTAVAAFATSSRSRLDLAFTGLWFLGCGWTIFAYHYDRWMVAIDAASMDAGQEPSRRKATYVLNIFMYFLFVAMYVWQRYR